MVRNTTAREAARQTGAVIRQTLYIIGVVLSWTAVGLYRGAPGLFIATTFLAPIAVIFSGHVIAGFVLQGVLAVMLFTVGPLAGGILVEILLAAFPLGLI